jgi:hypothetical protein
MKATLLLSQMKVRPINYCFRCHCLRRRYPAFRNKSSQISPILDSPSPFQKESGKANCSSYTDENRFPGSELEN